MSEASNSGVRIIRRRRWTEQEDNTIRTLYGTTSAAEIGQLIDRTENAVWIRAVKTLKLGKRDEVTPWTDAELTELKRCYATEAPTALAARLGRTPTSIYQQARVLGLLSHKKLIGQAVNRNYFKKIDTAARAYALGLMAADGNVSDSGAVTFGLQEKDSEVVRWLRDEVSPSSMLSISKRSGFVSFHITSRELAAGLAQWGIVPRKSRSLEWPASLGVMLRPFLLGYFDGDGCGYTYRRGSRVYPGWTVCSGSEQFLVDMKGYILAEAGVALQKIQHRPTSSLYQVAVCGEGAYLLDGWLHQDGLGMARKRFPAHAIERYPVPSRNRA